MSDSTVIARGGLNLRRSPKTGKIVKTLRRGSKVEVLGQETWLRVKTRDGNVGYVLGDFIETSPDSDARQPRAKAGDSVAPSAEPSRTAEAAETCDIQLYRAERFVGSALRADRDFWPSLDRIGQYAVECDVEIHVTSSAREPGRTVSGAIVKPAGRSNHLVGHAIDMNVVSKNGFFNSKALKRANLDRQPKEVRDFIDKIRADPELRWGGDFSKEDPVHIDDGLNLSDPKRWDSKLASRK